MTNDIMTMTIENAPFNSRETYLAWRAEWRRQYRELSVGIRANKFAVNNGMREGTRVGTFRDLLVRQRSRATDMLVERAEAKIIARQQRELATAS